MALILYPSGEQSKVAWREIIRKEEPTITTKNSDNKEKAFEQKTARDILIFVQNLDDFEEADMFTTLYTKVVNNTLESNKENYRIDENEVRNIIAKKDERLVYREELCEEYESMWRRFKKLIEDLHLKHKIPQVKSHD